MYANYGFELGLDIDQVEHFECWFERLPPTFHLGPINRTHTHTHKHFYLFALNLPVLPKFERVWLHSLPYPLRLFDSESLPLKNKKRFASLMDRHRRQSIYSKRKCFGFFDFCSWAESVAWRQQSRSVGHHQWRSDRISNHSFVRHLSLCFYFAYFLLLQKLLLKFFFVNFFFICQKCYNQKMALLRFAVKSKLVPSFYCTNWTNANVESCLFQVAFRSCFY